MTVNGVYSYKSGWLLIDMTIEAVPDDIDWFGFFVEGEDPDVSVGASPYMEQFLSADGNEKICETWDEPEDYDLGFTRVAFFLKPGSGDNLITPYGAVSLKNPSKTPDYLIELIYFEFPGKK